MNEKPVLTPAEVHDLKKIVSIVERTKPKEWIIGEEHGEDGKTHCFLGHMENAKMKTAWRRIEDKLTRAQYLELWDHPDEAPDVNDDENNRHYPQSTPRGRCRAFLRDVMKFFGVCLGRPVQKGGDHVVSE